MTNGKIFKLWYSINNHGDGSASVLISKTESEAVKEDESQDDCYSESTVRNIRLRIVDGKICRFNHYWNDKELQWVKEWVELEQE